MIIPDDEQLLLLKFDASWCEPCKWAQPIVDSVILHYGGRLVLKKVDIEDFPEEARQHHVLSVPTLVLLKNGKEVWRMRGFDTVPALILALDPFINEATVRN